MSNKRLLIKIIVLLLVWIYPLPAHTAPQSPIAVLLSNDLEAYHRPLQAFKDQVNMEVKVFNLHGNIKNAKLTINEILAANPGLIFTLGAKAAYSIKLLAANRPDIPVIFAMVLNWKRYKLLEGCSNFAGIATEVSPGTQFANLTMFSPHVKRVGIIYSEKDSAEIVSQARQAASYLDLEIIAAPIEKAGDFRRAFKKIVHKIDSYWILNDPVVFTAENMAWLERMCIQKDKICIGQSEKVVMAILLT